jgi:Protein of unknown function (DUF3025)
MLLDTHPAFDFIRPQLDRIDRSALLASLNALARERGVEIAFVCAREQKLSAVDYERRIVHVREVIVHDNWHDIFNACVWLIFPQTKRVISELHVELGSGENNRRPRRRDVLTLFDESGLIFLCTPALCDEFKTLNEMHQWKKLFVERRREFIANVKPLLFGHGALEQLSERWHRGLTVKALWLPLDLSSSFTDIDTHLASSIRTNEALSEDERRIPMPLLGIPRWFAENEESRCYDDASIFRPVRSHR